MIMIITISILSINTVYKHGSCLCFIERLDQLLTGSLVVRQAGGLAGWLARWPAGRLTGRPAGLPAEHLSTCHMHFVVRVIRMRNSCSNAHH